MALEGRGCWYKSTPHYTFYRYPLTWQTLIQNSNKPSLNLWEAELRFNFKLFPPIILLALKTSASHGPVKRQVNSKFKVYLDPHCWKVFFLSKILKHSKPWGTKWNIYLYRYWVCKTRADLYIIAESLHELIPFNFPQNYIFYPIRQKFKKLILLSFYFALFLLQA